MIAEDYKLKVNSGRLKEKGRDDSSLTFQIILEEVALTVQSVHTLVLGL